MSEPNKLAKLLKAFLSARNVTIDADGLRMWIDAFSDLTPEAIELALRRYNRECTDHPTPAAVRRYAGAAGLTDEQRALVGWRVVRSSVLRYGAYYSIDFDDKIIHAAVRAIGGWASLCSTQHDEMQWKQKQFIEAYLNVARSGIGEFHQLAGLLDDKAEPVKITTGMLQHAALRHLANSHTAPIARIGMGKE